MPPTRDRLAGVELMRAVTAFAVIGIHAGIVVHNHTSHATYLTQQAFGFAVPFFLLVSFFFALQSKEKELPSWSDWCAQIARRLVLPFVVWGVIYSGLRIAKFSLQHDPAGLRNLIHDPVTLIISGGSALALYFVPLLLVGLLLCRLLGPLLEKIPTKLLVLFTVLTALISAFLDRSGDLYDLATARGFESAAPGLNHYQILRILLVVAAHALRDLPILLTALVVLRGWQAESTIKLISAGVIFLAITTWLHLNGGVDGEFLRALGPLYISLGLSRVLPSNGWITMLGAFSFGIYLVHQLVLEAMQMLVQRLDPNLFVDFPLFVLVTASAFAVSALVVAAASRCGALTRNIFGLR